MAGDWIKMESATPDKPEVFAITVLMGWDDPDLTVGKLFRVWRWFDQHTTDGNAAGVTESAIDRIACAPGFAAAMRSVGWLASSDQGITLPGFGKHCGKTAKERAQTAKRVAAHKSNGKANASGNGASVTTALPREDKREDIEEPPLTPPSGGNPGGTEDQKPQDPEPPPPPKRERRPAIEFQTFLALCRERGESAIAGYEPMVRYVEEAQLPMEFAQLCWDEFKRRHLKGGGRETKRQADWRRTFLNCLQGNWFNLWWSPEPGRYEFTSAGLQAKTVLDARRAASDRAAA